MDFSQILENPLYDVQEGDLKTLLDQHESHQKILEALFKLIPEGIRVKMMTRHKSSR